MQGATCHHTYGTVSKYVIFPYVNRALTSLYDENKLCVSYLQPKFTIVSTEFVIDSRKRKQQQESCAIAKITARYALYK